MSTTTEDRFQDRQRLRELQRLMQIFLKAGKTLRLYSEDHRYFDQFTDDFHERLGHVLQDIDEITFEITPSAIQWDGHAVLENQEQRENLAYKLYRDGVRFLQFRKGVSTTEIRDFVTLVAREVDSSGGAANDLSVLFWESDFKHIHVSVAETFVQYNETTARLLEALERDQEELRSAFDPGSVLDLPMHEPEAFSRWAEAARGGEREARDQQDVLPDVPQEAFDEGAMAALYAELQGTEAAYASFEEVAQVLGRVIVAETDPARIDALLHDLDAAIVPMLATASIGPVSALLRRVALLGRQASERGWPSAEPLARFLRDLCSAERFEAVGRALDGDWDEGMKGNLFTLISVQHPDRVPDLLQFLSRVSNPAPRRVVIDALVLLADRRAEPFVEHLRTARGTGACDAIQALARIGDPTTMDLIVAAASRPEGNVRLEALTALKEHSSPRIQETMLARLLDDEPEVRLAALRWIVVYRVADAVPTLVRVVKQRDFDERKFEERRGWAMAWGSLQGREAFDFWRRIAEPSRGKEDSSDRLHTALLGIKACRLPEGRAFLEEFARHAKGDQILLARKVLL